MTFSAADIILILIFIMYFKNLKIMRTPPIKPRPDRAPLCALRAIHSHKSTVLANYYYPARLWKYYLLFSRGLYYDSKLS